MCQPAPGPRSADATDTQPRWLGRTSAWRNRLLVWPCRDTQNRRRKFHTADRRGRGRRGRVPQPHGCRRTATLYSVMLMESKLVTRCTAVPYSSLFGGRAIRGYFTRAQPLERPRHDTRPVSSPRHSGGEAALTSRRGGVRRSERRVNFAVKSAQSSVNVALAKTR